MLCPVVLQTYSQASALVCNSLYSVRMEHDEIHFSVDMYKFYRETACCSS